MSRPRRVAVMNRETKKSSSGKVVPKRQWKRVRFICNDPDATDSSDDEEVMHNNKVKQACFTVEDSKDTETSKEGSVTVKYRGVRLRKWGRWGAEIRNPILGKRMWLGHFATAEEASRAYETKRREFDALMKPVKSCSNNVVHGIEKPKVCLSTESGGRAFSVTSNTSPSSVLEMEKSCLNNRKNGYGLPVLVATNATEPNQGGHLGILPEDLTPFADIGAQVDLGLDPNVLGEFDFAREFDDIPLVGFENTYTELPDYDFDFDSEPWSWIDDEPIGTNTSRAEPVPKESTTNNGP